MYLRVIAFIFFVAAVGLSGCSSSPSHDQATHPPSSGAQAKDALANAPKRKRAELALAWAEQYIEEQRYAEALEVLNDMDPEALSNTDYQLRWYQMTAFALLSEGHTRKAGVLLDEPALTRLLEQQDSSTRANFELLHADILALEGKPLQSVTLRFSIDSQLDTENQAYNQQLIWQLLQRLSAEELDELADNSNLNGQGWIELAQLYSNEFLGLEEQIKQLHQWQRRWWQHAAIKNPPADIANLEKALKDRPRHIAVLLPEQGAVANAAHALRDGLLAAYYVSLEQGHDTPELRFYDSANEVDIVDLYYKAADDGAELIIGPLEKDNVIALSRLKNLPVDLLSLNYHDQDAAPSNLIQFGLSPEDEANQVAKLAHQQGLSRMGLLFPNSATGDRTAHAFAQAWEELGGVVVDQHAYGQDASEAVSRLLKVDAYQARTQRNKNVSRKDIDAIFVVATAEQGRQIKPAIDFYHGNHLPIFSTSMIYDAQPNRQRDNDLNRIQFVDIPWLLTPDDKFHSAAAQAWPKQHGRYERIFALGVDAYQLSQRLTLMNTSSHNRMEGLTGTLTLNEQSIKRTLLPARFVRGEATYDKDKELQHAPISIAPLNAPTTNGASR